MSHRNYNALQLAHQTLIGETAGASAFVNLSRGFPVPAPSVNTQNRPYEKAGEKGRKGDGRISTYSLCRSYQNDLHVHHVGVGRPRDYQAAERLEVVVGIVVFQVAARVGIAAQGATVGHGAGGIGGAVGAIGARAEDDDILQPGDIDGGSQRELLVAAAEAAAS